MNKYVSVILVVCVLLCLAATCAVADVVSVPASSARFAPDVFENGKKNTTAYNTKYGVVAKITDGGEIIFTVPDGVEGEQDLYLNVGRAKMLFSSQPFCYRINDGEIFSAAVDCDKVIEDSNIENGIVGTQWETGVFLIRKNVMLKPGDQVTIIAQYGVKGGKVKGKAYPVIGDMLIATPGTPIPLGFNHTVSVDEVNPDDPLSGKHLVWLGSSVTYGAASEHYAVADAIADRHAATQCDKYAISATTLVNNSVDSYVARMKLIPKDIRPDLIIVQLSTNDASTNQPFGEIADGYEMTAFDDTTIAGAIETIIAYSQETFKCPVAFYSGSFCDKENYPEMVALLLQISEKWGIPVIDLFNNEEMTAIYHTELYHEYMADEIHPTRRGYVEWWTPVFEDALTAFFAESAALE